MNPLKASIGVVVAALAATTILYPTLEAEAAEPRQVVVEIREFAFVPADLTVSAGDVVVWRNFDIVPHTATSKDKSWDSGAIEANGEWQTTVAEDMAGAYFCRFHPSMVAILEIRSE